MTPKQKLHLIGIRKAFATHLSTFEGKLKERYPDNTTFLKAIKDNKVGVAQDIVLLRKGRSKLKEIDDQLGIKITNSDSHAASASSKE